MIDKTRIEKPGAGRWAREFFLHYFGGLYNRFGGHHILLLSGGLAFSFFTCVVPLILVLFSVLGVILQKSSIEVQVTTSIDSLIPYPEYAAYAKGIIFSRIDEVVANKRLAGYIGVIGLMIAASSLFSSMRTILNMVFGEGKGKHLLIGKVRDFGMILLVLVFFLLSTTILPMTEVAKELAARTELLQLLHFSAFQNEMLQVVTFSVIFLMFCVLYYLIPYSSIGGRSAIVSAFWASVMWEFAQEAFGYYMANIASFGRIYGAYVTIVVVVFWIYYSSVVFVLGAEIGQLYRERRPTMT